VVQSAYGNMIFRENKLDHHIQDKNRLAPLINFYATVGVGKLNEQFAGPSQTQAEACA